MSASDDDLGPEARYFRYLAEGRFMLQRSRATGEHVFYPRVASPRAGARDLEWVEATGRATVYATTVVRRRPERGGDYNVVLVDLDEGPRMMSRVVDVPPEAVRIGMRVEARIVEEEGSPLLVFAPAGEAA